MQQSFERLATDSHSNARRGRLTTAHGEIDTPTFMPVGTQGSVKGVSPRELREMNAQIVLGNTYHMFVRPGLDVIKYFGGLHNFMNWDGPILTDSGGYQIFSLAKLRKITDDGVEFQNHLDGARAFISPEVAMEIQAGLGGDIAMALDECVPYPCEYDYAAQSAKMTTRWAKRCKEWREQNAQRPTLNAQRSTDGVASAVSAESGADALGLGTPPQLLEMIARGMDMFDCVLPTRLARNGTAFAAAGTLNLKNAEFALDKNPIEENCTCQACREFSCGYIRHLIKAEEILGLRLITLHNLHFYLNLMSRARTEIESGTFDQFRKAFVAEYKTRDAITVE